MRDGETQSKRDRERDKRKKFEKDKQYKMAKIISRYNKFQFKPCRCTLF